MASQQVQRKAKKPQPVTANPLFPAVVALWFGALFGLSSLAVRVSVIETLVRMSKLDLVLHAAAPPLGITARILVALGMAALGAIVGTLISRFLTRPKKEVRERKRNARQPDAQEADDNDDLTRFDRALRGPALVRRPISVHEDLAEAATLSFERSAEGVSARRRSLTAMHEQEEQRFVPQGFAPLPGGLPQVLDLAGAELEQPTARQVFVAEVLPAQAAEAVCEPAPAMDLNAFDDHAPETVDDQPFVPPVATALTPSADENALAGRQVFGLTPAEAAESADPQIFEPPADEVIEEPVAEPVAKTVIAAPEPEVAQAPAAPFTTPAEFAAPTPPVAAVEAPVAEVAQPQVLEPLEDLGMVDLALRLQQAMERRRIARAGVSAPAALTPVADFNLVPAVPAPAAPEVELPAAAPAPAYEAPAPVFAMPTELPAALRPISISDDLDEDEDEVVWSILPPRQLFTAPPLATDVQPAAAPLFAAPQIAKSDVEPEVEPAAEEGYASLLNVAAPAPRSPFVRIEEPATSGDSIEPVVIFPGQASRIAFAAPGATQAAAVPPVTSPVAEETQFRRFDAPASATQGVTVAATQGGSALDPEETERSLRAALSSLQRISGAA